MDKNPSYPLHIPQSYPFLLIDRILQASEHHILTERSVSEGDLLTASGSYLLENMAQSASALLGFRYHDAPPDLLYLAEIRSARICCCPSPGDSVRTDVSISLAVGGFARVSCHSLIRKTSCGDWSPVGDAELTLAFRYSGK